MQRRSTLRARAFCRELQRQGCREGLPGALRAGVDGKRRQDAGAQPSPSERSLAERIEFTSIRESGIPGPSGPESGNMGRSERPATGHGQPRPPRDVDPACGNRRAERDYPEDFF